MDAYRVELLRRVAALHGDPRPWPKRDQEWGGAGQCYREKLPLELVEAAYREEMRKPRWQTAYLSLSGFQATVKVYARNPAGFRAGVERMIKAAGGGYEAERAAREARADARMREFERRRTAAEAPSGTAMYYGGELDPE